MQRTISSKHDSINRDIWLSLYYYYIEGLSLTETAKRMGVHRLKVTRNLAKAKQDQMFSVILQHPQEIELEGSLMRRFPGLKDARVVPIISERTEIVQTVLGQVCAKYLECLIDEYKYQNIGMRVKIGLAGGATVSKVVDSMTPGKFTGLDIYPLAGGPYAQNALAAGALVDRLASKYQNSTRYEIVRFHPATNEERKKILSLQYVSDVLEKIKTVDFAVVGIGNLSENSTLGRTAAAMGLDIESLRKSKICGDICSLLLSEPEGNIVQDEILNLIIGISAKGLKEISRQNKGRVIAVSGGIEKTQAIVAALLGGTNGKEPWIDTIITDQRTCEKVLEFVNERDISKH